MQEYTKLHHILVSGAFGYEEFESAFLSSGLTQQTYLNLFLVTATTNKDKAADFARYFALLVYGEGRKNANPNSTGYRDKLCVLDHACAKAASSVVETLLRYEGIVVPPHSLFHALRNPSPSQAAHILRLLLTHDPTLIDAEESGSTLLCEAIASQRLECVSLLLQSGISPNFKIKANGHSYFHQAIRLSTHFQLTQKIVDLLLIHGADPNLTNDEGLNSYQYALSHNNGLCELFLPKEQKDNQLSTIFIPFSARESSIDLSEYDKKEKSVLLTTSASNRNENGFEIWSSMKILQQKSTVQTKEMTFDTATQLNSTKLEDTVSNKSFRTGNCSKEEYAEMSRGWREENMLSLEEAFPVFAQESQSEDDLLEAFPDTDSLHEEIMTYASECMQKHEAAICEIQPVLVRLSELTTPFGLVIEIVGSFRSGLWLQSSDIDVALLPEAKHYIDFERTLEHIYRELQRRKREWGIESLAMLRSKVRSIRIEMGEKYSRRRLDVSIFHRHNNSSKYSLHILSTLQCYPQIQPLFFTLKRLSAAFGFTNHHSGTLKTYTWFLLIHRVVQHNYTHDLGRILIEVVREYGFHFQYSYDGDEEDHHAAAKACRLNPDLPVMRLSLEDPLNNKNNAGGKNIKAKELQSMFRAIFYALHLKGAASPFATLLQIASLF